MSSTISVNPWSSRLRAPNSKDFDLICCKLKEAIDKNRDTEVVRNLVVEEAVKRIVEQSTCDALILDDTILIVFGVGKPWYADRVMLQEYMVLRLRDGTTFSEYCDALEYLASTVGAETIVVGSQLAHAPKALVRKYVANGFMDTGSPTLIRRRQP